MALAATSFARALREPLRLFTIEGGALEYVHGGEQLIKGTRSHPAARLSSTTPHRDLVLHESGVLESDAPGGSRSDRDQVDRLEQNARLIDDCGEQFYLANIRDRVSGSHARGDGII
eukprot:2365052-Prymnesium_polylepis.1